MGFGDVAGALAAELHGGEVDAIKEEGEFQGRDRQGGRGVGRRGKREGTPLQAFVPEGHAVAVPVQDFEAVAPAGGENEEVSGKGVGAADVAGEGGEAVEGQAHVDGGEMKVNAGVGVRVQHGAGSRAWRSAAR